MSSGKSIVIAGGTGFLGAALGRALAGSGHAVTVLSRGRGAPADPIRTVEWSPDGSVGPWAAAVDGADAVVNLSGEPIAARRWTAEQKDRIRRSRVDATASLAEA